MDSAILHLLEFYQRELRESREGQEAAEAVKILTPSLVEKFGIGYASGKAKAICSKGQLKVLRSAGLIDRKELFSKHLAVPILGAQGELVDLWGIRPKPRNGQRRFIFWHTPPRGLFNRKCLRTCTNLIICESLLRALEFISQGYKNTVAFASVDTLVRERKAMKYVERAVLFTRGLDEMVAKCLEGVEIRKIKRLSGGAKPDLKKLLEAPKQVEKKSCSFTMEEPKGGGVCFFAGEVSYEVDGQSSHLSLRVQIKARRDGRLYLDRCDLGSAGSRRQYARGCSNRLQFSSNEAEDHLDLMVEALEKREEKRQEAEETGPKELSDKEKKDAMSLLKDPKFLEYQADALEDCFGYVAEPENKRIGLLVAASRLLSKPLGGIVRGPAASGKSALILAISKLLSPWDVLYFSRITAQSLYFLPREMLAHKVLICDEYEGLEDAEYALRSMMSNQVLSLAITIRDGGRVPVTRTVEIPATVSVLVSTTQAVNIENLSRFLELKLDTSPAQTRKVLCALARGAPAGNKPQVQRLQCAGQLLRPCRVDVPFADKLIYESGTVLARRQFAQVVGLISAHAALYQYQRDSHEEKDGLMVIAEEADYQAVYPLLTHVVDHVEEHLSPAAMELLSAMNEMPEPVVMLREMQEKLGWSYTKTYRLMRELEKVELVRGDRHSVGKLKVYERAPYLATTRGIARILPPVSGN